MSFTRLEKQSFDYFYKGDKIDVFVQNLDCYSADIYFILKYKYHINQKIETYFMDDISYSQTIPSESHFLDLLKFVYQNYNKVEYTLHDVTYYPGIYGLKKLLELNAQGKL